MNGYISVTIFVFTMLDVLLNFRDTQGRGLV